MNPKMLELLGGKSEHYPVILETRFKRVFDRVLALWGTRDFDPFISELFISDQDSRQGFPPEAMEEIFRLSNAHDAAMQRRQEAGLWDTETAKRGLAEMKIELSARGIAAAIETGNERAVELFIEAGFNLETRNNNGWTPLMISSFFGKAQSAATLIKAGAQIDARDNDGYAPIHWASIQGYESVVALLLDKGANVNEQSLHGITPLLQAAAAGHLGTVRILLQRGARPSLADDHGWTAAHKAVANNHADVVRELVKYGTDVEAENSAGLTPIGIAKQKKRDQLLAILMALPETATG